MEIVAGNFLVSRCLEVGGPELAAVFTKTLNGMFLTMSLDQFGKIRARPKRYSGANP